MYAIADKYGIQGLKILSMQNMKAALQDDTWMRSSERMTSSEWISNSEWVQSVGWVPTSQKSYTPSMIMELTIAVHAAWTLTPESDGGVRALLLDYALTNKEALLQAEEFKLVIQHTPQFACDLLIEALVRKSNGSNESFAVHKKAGKKRGRGCA